MKLHNCGLDNYKRYIAYARQLAKWEVHNPDCKIITDAHDCGLKNGDVTFVSADEALITKIVKNKVSFLKIIEFRCIN